MLQKYIRNTNSIVIVKKDDKSPLFIINNIIPITPIIVNRYNDHLFIFLMPNAIIIFNTPIPPVIAPSPPKAKRGIDNRKLAIPSNNNKTEKILTIIETSFFL